MPANDCVRFGKNGSFTLSYNYITIQSLASDYKLKEGWYNDVATCSGVIQHHISNCIVDIFISHWAHELS